MLRPLELMIQPPFGLGLVARVILYCDASASRVERRTIADSPNTGRAKIGALRIAFKPSDQIDACFVHFLELL
jgi:hypothetical protein